VNAPLAAGAFYCCRVLFLLPAMNWRNAIGEKLIAILHVSQRKYFSCFAELIHWKDPPSYIDSEMQSLVTAKAHQ
jgi:hypothetical protein